MRRRKRIAATLAALVGLAAAEPVNAKDVDRSPGIIGTDDREIVDSWDPPWGAIGQVNVSGYRTLGLCTGTLVAPKIVLTAAHCVVDGWKNAPHPANQIHFVAGVRRDKSLGHSTARCVRLPPGYSYLGPRRIQPDLPIQSVPFESFMRDIAIIVLAESIPVPPVAMADGNAFAAGLPLTYAAYPSTRRFLLSVDRSCSLLEQADGLWGTDCDSHPGSSGGPILVEQQGELRVAAVLVGTVARVMTIGVPISEWTGISLDDACP